MRFSAGVDGNGFRRVERRTAEISGIHDLGGHGVDLGYETGLDSVPGLGLERVDQRKIRGRGTASDVNVAAGVHRNAVDGLVTAAAEISGEEHLASLADFQ